MTWFATVHGRLSVDTQQGRHRSALEPVRGRLVRGREGRSQTGASAARSGERRDLARRLEAIAGIKMLLGTDPKTDYKDKVARVEFR